MFLLLSCCRANPSSLPSMQVLVSAARRSLQDLLHLDFWEWSTWDPQICCLWECTCLVLLSFFSFCYGQAWFTKSLYWWNKTALQTPSTWTPSFRSLLLGLFQLWLEQGPIYVIKPTCFLSIKWNAICRGLRSFLDIYCMEVLPGLKAFSSSLLPENFRDSIPMLWNFRVSS